jgi:hypothetical protein
MVDQVRCTSLRVGAEVLPLNHVRAGARAIMRVADLPGTRRFAPVVVLHLGYRKGRETGPENGPRYNAVA